MIHRKPKTFSDKFALSITMGLRWFADTFFATRYGHRAVVLETVAGVPGMVAGMWNHLRSLRKMRPDDRGWIRQLLEEAEKDIKISNKTISECDSKMETWIFQRKHKIGS